MTIPALEPFTKPKAEVGVAELVAEEALYICENMSFERQRSIDIKHVANLVDELEHDEWIGMSMLLFGNFRRKLKLVDGQHRLMAHAEFGRRSGAPVPRKYVIQVVGGDAAFAYSRLDSRQKKRPSHVAAHALNLDVPAILAKSAIDAADAAIRYRTGSAKRVEVGNTRTPMDRPYRDTVQYVNDHRDAFHTLGTAFDNLTPHDSRVRNALLRKSVLPICIETVAAVGDKAVRFWRAVLCGENADKAARYVRDKMHQPLTYHAHKAARERALTAAVGWNAHVTGTIFKPRDKRVALKETDLVIG